MHGLPIERRSHPSIVSFFREAALSWNRQTTLNLLGSIIFLLVWTTAVTVWFNSKSNPYWKETMARLHLETSDSSPFSLPMLSSSFSTSLEKEKTITISINYTGIRNTSWLPQPPPAQPIPATATSSTISNQTVLVVYSGPTSFVNESALVVPPDSTFAKSFRRLMKPILYQRNFEHFLQYGVQCQTQDTVLVVTETVKEYYQSKIDQLHKDCHHRHGRHVWMVTRNNTCFDLETVRRVLHDDHVIPVPLDHYDYFVYVNCGTSGPSRKWAPLPWTRLFTDKIKDGVKLVGLSLNGVSVVHVQSMVYATDRVGLQLLRKKEKNTVIFNCLDPSEQRSLARYRNKTKIFVISRYERGMSRLFLKHGYGLTSLLKPTVVFQHNMSYVRNNPLYKDQWFKAIMTQDFGRILDLEHTVFFKTSRISSDATSRELQLPFRHNFWE